MKQNFVFITINRFFKAALNKNKIFVRISLNELIYKELTVESYLIVYSFKNSPYLYLKSARDAMFGLLDPWLLFFCFIISVYISKTILLIH